MPSHRASHTPTSPISSCEWTASYRSRETRPAIVASMRLSSTTLVPDGPMRTFRTSGGLHVRKIRTFGISTSRPIG